MLSRLRQKISGWFGGNEIAPTPSDNGKQRLTGPRGKNHKAAKRDGAESAHAGESNKNQRNKSRTSRRRTGRRTKPQGETIATSAAAAKETAPRKKKKVELTVAEPASPSPTTTAEAQNAAPNTRPDEAPNGGKVHAQTPIDSTADIKTPLAAAADASPAESVAVANESVVGELSDAHAANGGADLSAVLPEDSAGAAGGDDSETVALLAQLAAEHQADDNVLAGALAAVGCDLANGNAITAEVREKLASYFARRNTRAAGQDTELKMVESASAQIASPSLQQPEVREIAYADGGMSATPTPIPASNPDLQQVETKSS